MNDLLKANTGVLGAGTWGCTLASLLSPKAPLVRLWDSSSQVRQNLLQTRTPFKLPHLKLPTNVLIDEHLSSTVADSDLLIIVVPSHAVRSLCEQLVKADPNLDRKIFVLCSKGLEQETLLPLSGVMVDVMGEAIRDRFCYLSGPTHAEEVSRKMPTSIVASAYNLGLARRIQEIFHTDYLRVYTHDDVLGAELGGAIKNVIAIAAGICDGLGFGDNTKAALITRGLAEIIRLAVTMGARRETFSGLAGVGDLIVTATSNHSRNRNFGWLLAKGRSMEEAMKEIGMVVEGVRTAHTVMALARKHNVQMPISREIYRILYEGKAARDAVPDLMERSPKPEIYGPGSP